MSGICSAHQGHDPACPRCIAGCSGCKGRNARIATLTALLRRWHALYIDADRPPVVLLADTDAALAEKSGE